MDLKRSGWRIPISDVIVIEVSNKENLGRLRREKTFDAQSQVQQRQVNIDDGFGWSNMFEGDI